MVEIDNEYVFNAPKINVFRLQIHLVEYLERVI